MLPLRARILLLESLAKLIREAVSVEIPRRWNRAHVE